MSHSEGNFHLICTGNIQAKKWLAKFISTLLPGDWSQDLKDTEAGFACFKLYLIRSEVIHLSHNYAMANKGYITMLQL